MRFKQFLDEQLSEDFNRFVTLYYPGPRKRWLYKTHHEYWVACLRDAVDEEASKERRYRFMEAQRARRVWLSEVRSEAGPNFGYLMVIQKRPSRGDFMFHLLLRGCENLDFECHWAQRWHQISGGKTFLKEIDERIGGLLRFFVREGCVLEVSTGSQYSKDDFEDWQDFRFF